MKWLSLFWFHYIMPINFRSKLHQALLAHYSLNPNSEYYVRDLSRILSFDVAFLSRELATLTRAGIFVSFTRNRQKYFRLNHVHPIYNEIKNIAMYLVAKKATKRNDASIA